MRTCYMHHLHTTLDDIRIGEEVFMAYCPDDDATMRVTNGVVASVNATSVRTTGEATTAHRSILLLRTNVALLPSSSQSRPSMWTC